MNQQLIKALVLVSIIIGVSILGYGYLKYDYGMKTIQAQKDEQLSRQETLTRCGEKAEEDYSSYWDAQCEVEGLDVQSAGCTLPRNIALDIETRREKALNNCVKLFRP